MNRAIIRVLLVLISTVKAYSASQTPSIQPQAFFRENKGQVMDQNFNPRNDVLFYGESGGLNYHFTKKGFSYQLFKITEKEHSFKHIWEKNLQGFEMTINRIDLNWVNSDPNVEISTTQELSGHDNYYLASCPNGALGVKSYGGITYHKIYPGIDMLWHSEKGKLKYDYLVQPAFDHSVIKLEIKGAISISVNAKGRLVIKTTLGDIVEEKPLVIQNGKILEASWLVNNNIVSFNIKGVDKNFELRIDPMIRLWGTYYGGSGADDISYLHVDDKDNLFLTGGSQSISNIATTGAFQTTFGGSGNYFGDAYLAKFNSSGVRQWSTYYGGSNNEGSGKCVTDALGNIYMTGSTSSTNTGVIATAGAHQTLSSGGQTGYYLNDAFLVKFDSLGVRLWGTYFGGNSYENGSSCDVDEFNNVYMVGFTGSSNNISSSGSHQTNLSGSMDGFIAKFSANGTKMWSSYYGGSNTDLVNDCKYDKKGNIYFTGDTKSLDAISTPGSHQFVYGGGSDCFLTKFDTSGVRQWGTYYGGANSEDASSVCIDKNGDIYLGGETQANSNAIATPGSHQATYGGGTFDMFLVKFNSGGIRQWATFYGGIGEDRGSIVSSDGSGNVFIAGFASFAPLGKVSTQCTYQDKCAGSQFDACLTKFNSNGVRQWGTYYGGAYNEYGWYCHATSSGEIYLSGITFGSSGSIIGGVGSHQSSYGGGSSDGFLVKFDGCRPPANTTSSADQIICIGDTTSLTTTYTCGINWYDNLSGSPIASDSMIIVSPSANMIYYIQDISCGPDIGTTPVSVTVNPLPQLIIDPPKAMLCYNSSVGISVSGANSYTWSLDKWISCTNCADPIVSPLETIQYTVTGIDANSCINQATVNVETNLDSGHDFSTPNAFTPNNDGINDKFCLQGWDLCNDNFKIIIFDRWGEKVFESEDPDFCWNGLYKGQLLSSDVYVFSIHAAYKDGTEMNKKGNITLIR
jgi:gliding motility-associated-like protein